MSLPATGKRAGALGLSKLQQLLDLITIQLPTSRNACHPLFHFSTLLLPPLLNVPPLVLQVNLQAEPSTTAMAGLQHLNQHVCKSRQRSSGGVPKNSGCYAAYQHDAWTRLLITDSMLDDTVSMHEDSTYNVCMDQLRALVKK